MKDKKHLYWVVGLVLITIILCGTLIWINHNSWTLRFEMDDNTSNYLNEHDYCFFTEQTSYDSSEPSIIFVGDCQYLNTTILKVS